METLKITFAVVSLLTIVTSIPMILEKVPPNPIYGFRTKKTLSDPDIWYEMNAYAGRLLFIWGIIMAATAIVLDRIQGLKVQALANIFILVVLGIGAIVMILSFNHLRKL